MLDDVWSWSYTASSIGSIILLDWGHTPVERRIFYNHRIKCFPELIYVIFLSKYLLSAIQIWCYTFLYTYILYDSDKCYISSNDSIYLHHLMEWGDITILYILLIDTEVSINIHTPQSAIPTHTIYIYIYIYIGVFEAVIFKSWRISHTAPNWVYTYAIKHLRYLIKWSRPLHKSCTYE